MIMLSQLQYNTPVGSVEPVSEPANEATKLQDQESCKNYQSIGLSVAVTTNRPAWPLVCFDSYFLGLIYCTRTKLEASPSSLHS